MNTNKHDERSTAAAHSPHIEFTQRVGGVNTDSNRLAWLDAHGTNRLKVFQQ
jgi:hypothetical protein